MLISCLFGGGGLQVVRMGSGLVDHRTLQFALHPVHEVVPIL